MTSTGVSVGWFDPTALSPDPQALVRAIKKFLGPRVRKTRAWPFAVSSIRWNRENTGVAYAYVAGPVPIHIDTVGLNDVDGRIFQFVLEVENRPTLMCAPQRPETTAIFEGYAPPNMAQTLGLGCVELKVGQAIHFDITTHYHGITGLPVPMESTTSDIAPRAIIVQVGGFAANQVGAALDHAARLVALDAGFSR